MGIAGIRGLSIVYFKLGSSSLPGTVLTILTAVLLVVAVFMAIYADLSHPLKRNQGDEKKNEISFLEIPFYRICACVYANSKNTSGFCSAIRNKASAGPLGLRRPCSQS